MWLALAFASAFFAGIGAVLSKAAKEGIDPDAASAVRFTVIFILAWISPIVTGSVRSLTEIGLSIFCILSSPESRWEVRGFAISKRFHSET